MGVTGLAFRTRDTKDVDETYAFLRSKRVESVGEIERSEPVSFFRFKDPDGNLLMACQQHSP